MKLWIRIDAAVRSDPNVAALAERLKMPFTEAVGMCVLVWAALAEHRPNGDITGISISTLEKWAEFRPRKGKPPGSFGKAFLDLFASDGQASGWHTRQGALIDRAEKDRARKGRGKSADIPRKSAPTERNGTERNVVSTQEIVKSGEEQGSAPRVALPAEAMDFLNRFYEPALTDGTRKRYRDVLSQLYDVLDPKHPGPKIRGGVRVKARSPEHLVDTLKAVIADPPMDRDVAIVWLLKKLTDPPKGPSVTELKKKNESAERATEDRYTAASKSAGIAWAKDNPEAYQEILASVEATYGGRSGTIMKIARDSELTQRCAKACGFPRFEDWLERQVA